MRLPAPLWGSYKVLMGVQPPWVLCLSTFHSDSETLISKLNAKFTSILKEDFGPLGNSSGVSFYKACLCVWKLHKSLSMPILWIYRRRKKTWQKYVWPLFLNQPNILRVLLDNPLKAAVILLAGVNVLTILFFPRNSLWIVLDITLCEQSAYLGMVNNKCIFV